MYNLTDDQKKATKWIVENIRAGSLDEKFKYLIFTAVKSDQPKYLLTDREGNKYSPSAWINSGLTKESLEALSRDGLLSYEEVEPPPYQCWLCSVIDSLYTAVDSDFKKNFGFI